MIWKDIPGWENIYQASTEGQIRSKERRVAVFWKGKLVQKTYRSKILNTEKCIAYPHVKLVRSDKAKTYNVHDLILFTFIGPKPIGLEVLHGDGNKKNNGLSNLRYGTTKENSIDKFKHGYKVPLGSKNKLSKFNREDRKEIRKLLKTGYSIRCLAIALQTAKGTIERCLTNN